MFYERIINTQIYFVILSIVLMFTGDESIVEANFCIVIKSITPIHFIYMILFPNSVCRWWNLFGYLTKQVESNLRCIFNPHLYTSEFILPFFFPSVTRNFWQYRQYTEHDIFCCCENTLCFFLSNLQSGILYNSSTVRCQYNRQNKTKIPYSSIRCSLSNLSKFRCLNFFFF